MASGDHRSEEKQRRPTDPRPKTQHLLRTNMQRPRPCTIYKLVVPRPIPAWQPSLHSYRVAAEAEAEAQNTLRGCIYSAVTTTGAQGATNVGRGNVLSFPQSSSAVVSPFFRFFSLVRLQTRQQCFFFSSVQGNSVWAVRHS